jgi:hypothetical protein
LILLPVSAIFIFSKAWNCSSLYVSDRVARSRSKCCQESLNLSTRLFAFSLARVLKGLWISLEEVDHSRLSASSVTYLLNSWWTGSEMRTKSFFRFLSSAEIVLTSCWYVSF